MASQALMEREQPTGLAQAPSLLPVFGGREMTVAFQAYRELQKSLDAAMPDQIIQIGDRHFRRKGYWRAIATAFNLNVRCLKEESDDYGWRVTYEASTQSGRAVTGDGACESAEKAEGQDTEHNVRSHAHTRAFNRAVSNLVGFGEVSAEEMQQGRGGRASGYAAPPETVIDVKTQTRVPASERPEPPKGYRYLDGYKQSNNGWHEVTLKEPDGRITKLSTKRDALGAIAAEAYQQGIPVKVTQGHKEGARPGEAWLNDIEAYKSSGPVSPTTPLAGDSIAF